MSRGLLQHIVFMITYISLIAPHSLGQITVYSNFGPGHDGWDYTYTTGWTVAGTDVDPQYGVEQAMQFESTAEGILSDIWVAFFRVPWSTMPDTVTIRLCRNPTGAPPEIRDILEEWILTSFGTWDQWNPPIHLEGSGSTFLDSGATYWLWASGSATTCCGWCLNVNPSLLCPHTLRREGQNWLPISNETASVFRVDAMPLPPPEVVIQPWPDGVRLVWRRVPTATSYIVRYATSLDTIYHVLGVPTDTLMVVNTGANPQLFFYVTAER